MAEDLRPFLDSSGSVLFTHLFFNGQIYEVMLDVSGQWRGLVHLVDCEKPHDPGGTDVVFSGARWDFGRQFLTLGDAYLAPDVTALKAATLVAPTTDSLRRAVRELGIK